jgi:hypothetical protein
MVLPIFGFCHAARKTTLTILKKVRIARLRAGADSIAYGKTRESGPFLLRVTIDCNERFVQPVIKILCPHTQTGSLIMQRKGHKPVIDHSCE